MENQGDEVYSAGAKRGAPTREVILPENLKYLQTDEIQDLIASLKFLIPASGKN